MLKPEGHRLFKTVELRGAGS